MMAGLTEAGFTWEEVKRIVCRQSKILELSFQENILPKLQFLQGLRATAAGELLSEKEIRQLITKYPTILCLSLANIKGKLHYLVVELQREGCEILTSPAYLGHSMEGRIVPRARYMQACGVDQQRYALSSIFYTPDSKFCKTLGTDEEDYIAFKHSMCGN